MRPPGYLPGQRRQHSLHGMPRTSVSETTEEPMEHDAPHPSTIDPDPDEEWPDG